MQKQSTAEFVKNFRLVLLLESDSTDCKMSLKLLWTRPSNVPFPSVWLRFQAKDTVTDELVEYRVQDLPEDRFEDAITHMTQYYLADEPICECFDVLNKDPEFVADYQLVWRVLLPQRITLVCFKEGSDEIVGLNISFVLDKEDDFFTQLNTRVSVGGDVEHGSFGIVSFSFSIHLSL